MLLLAMPLHLGIAVCLGMITFGLVMLIGNLASFVSAAEQCAVRAGRSTRLDRQGRAEGGEAGHFATRSPPAASTGPGTGSGPKLQLPLLTRSATSGREPPPIAAVRLGKATVKSPPALPAVLSLSQQF